MTTREDIVTEALKFNGVGNGEGYPGRSNPFSQDLNRPNEFWCGDFITDIYKRAGQPLPSLQTGLSEGFDNCRAMYLRAKADNALIPSYSAHPGDIILIDTGATEVPGHVELVTSVTGGYLYSIGGDSGPSNIDKYDGQGGVHRHAWHGNVQGGTRIFAVADMGTWVHFTDAPTKPPIAPKHKGHRLLLLATPLMHGKDVAKVQRRLNRYGDTTKVDGIYGSKTANAVAAFQKANHLTVDSVVGPRTAKALHVHWLLP